MQRPPIPIRPAGLDDRARVAAIMADAFADDPALSFIFPDAATRPERLRRFFTLIQRTETDPALTTIAGDGAAAAIWRRPGEWQTPPLTMLRLAVPMLTTFGSALSRASQHQGKGFGGAAIRARLAQCDAQGLPAALETATESNLAIYRAMGFRITDEFKLADGPQFWGMWRDPL